MIVPRILLLRIQFNSITMKTCPPENASVPRILKGKVKKVSFARLQTPLVAAAPFLSIHHTGAQRRQLAMPKFVVIHFYPARGTYPASPKTPADELAGEPRHNLSCRSGCDWTGTNCCPWLSSSLLKPLPTAVTSIRMHNSAPSKPPSAAPQSSMSICRCLGSRELR